MNTLCRPWRSGGWVPDDGQWSLAHFWYNCVTLYDRRGGSWPSREAPDLSGVFYAYTFNVWFEVAS